MGYLADQAGEAQAVLLFGLVTKNSILLVDYANQLRAEGLDKLEAMRTAAPIRIGRVVWILLGELVVRDRVPQVLL